jgi:hypothetical protein
MVKLVRLEWRFYYLGGSTYSNCDGPAEFAPKVGAQAVVILDPAVGWQALYGTQGSDFFCYDAEWEVPRWRNMNRWGFQKYMEDPGMKVVVFGEWAGNHSFQALKTRITQEMGDRQLYPEDEDGGSA